MPKLLSCPTAPELLQFLLGQVPEQDTDLFQRHIKQCPRCLSALASMKAADTLVEAMRAQANHGPEADDRVVEHLMVKLNSLKPAPLAAGKTADFAANRAAGFFETETVNERPGTVIGAYKLLEQIGEGGFGVVFMAEQHHPVRRKVALKVLKPGMDTRQVVARFEAERQALAIMDHPNIAKVFDGGATASGRPYFVMELVKGVPITDFCDQNHLTPRQRLALFMPVCQAIQHAHQKGIIHRDLKPSNVLVTMHDATPVVKVIDFGVAKALGQELTDKTLFTGFAQMIGTPLYMSPEQAGQSGLDVDTRSDIYSLGVLLYELLTGTTPFDKARFRKAAHDEIRRIIREEEPPKPSTRLSELGRSGEQVGRFSKPSHETGATSSLASISALRHTEPAKLTKLVRGELDWIVMKALEKDRNRRYETANGFAMDVQRYLADEPVHACPPSTGYRLRKFLRRNKGPVLAVAIVVLALVGGIIGTTWGMLRATVAEADAVAEAKQKEQERDNAVKERERATQAELAGRQRLFEAKLAEAKASRWSRQVGQRFETWKALTEAALLACELKLSDDVFLTLRNEAIACLALADLKRIKEWQGFPPGSIGHAAFDADLERYARSDLKGNISVRRVADDQQLARLPGRFPGSGGRTMLFSPHGNLLAVSYWQNVPGQSTNFLLWDWKRAKVVFQPSFVISSFDFSPDGRQLALGQGDGTLTLHEAATGKEQKRFSLGSTVHHVAFHPDGSRLAACCPGQVQVRELATGKLLRTIPCPAHDLTWHPDGVLLGACCAEGLDSKIYLWDAITGRQHAVCQGHQSGGLRATFAPSGDMLVSNSWDGTSRVWDPWSGRELLRIPGAAGRFSRDGRQWVSTSGWNLSLFDVAEGRECRTLPKIQNLGMEGIGGGGFSPDGRWLAMATGKGVRLWDMALGKEGALLPISPMPHMQDVKLHPNGKQFFTGGASGLYEWPVQAHEGLLRLGPARKLPVRSGHEISLDREGRILAAADMGGALILDLANTAVNVRHVSHGNANHVATSPDGKWIATGTHNGFGVKVWATQTGRFEVELIKDERITTVNFSPDGRWLVTGTGNAFTVWAAGSWKLHRQIATDDQNGRSAFSSDGKLLAITLSASVVQLLDPATGRSFAKLSAPDPDRQSLVSFSPDNTQLVMSTGATAVRVWDLRRIREQLKEIGLDWDLPAYPPPPPPGDITPVKVEVDLGDFIAREKYTFILTMFPFYAEAYYQRGLAHGNFNQWQQACDDFNMALTLKPDHAEASYQRGLIHVRHGRVAEAIEDFSMALRLRPEHVEAYYERGRAYSASAQWDNAAADFSQTIRLNPEKALFWHNRGDAYAHLRQWDKAVNDQSKAIELKDDYWEAWYRRGTARFEGQQWDKAIADFTRAIELKPNYPQAWHDRAHAHDKAGQPDKALDDFSRSIDLNPASPQFRTCRGRAYAARGQHDRAIADYSKALEGLRPKLGPGHPTTQNAIHSLIDCYERLGKLGEAEPLCRELAEFWKKKAGADSPQYAGQLALLGMNLLGQKKPTEAEPVLRDCLAIRAKKRPDAWTTFNTKSMLGGALLGQKKYAAAEPLLLEGYEGMKQREAKILPMQGNAGLSDALERLVRLYDATGQTEKAAQWRMKLQAAKRADELWQDLLTGQQARHRFIETKQEGALTAAKQKQAHPLEMKAGTTYVLDMESKAFDTFLILEDGNGSPVAENDDISPTNLNSRLIYTAQTTATYRVIATCYRPGATGPYVLRIRELVEQK